VRRIRSTLALAGLATVVLGAVSCGSTASSGGAGPPPEPAVVPGPGPAHFGTLAPGSRLTSGAQCAAWVRQTALPENKSMNVPYNQVVGHHLASTFFDPASTDRRANSLVASRVDGAFTGTTQEILRWAACKWGVDEDLVYAQAVAESWWRQPTFGDWHPDASACAPGHGLGADGRPGLCPQSFGILQDRYPFQHSSWPGILLSTAMSADAAYATWRACYEGYERWLNTVEHAGPYGAGDVWGCVGRWVSGRWHTADAERYIAAVRGHLAQRRWEQPDFAQLSAG
jgi:hypothetical protein